MESLTVSEHVSAKSARSIARRRASELAIPGEVTRRDVLRIAAAWGLSFTLPPLESRAAERRGSERPKSLITLWLNGGPSQLESWDPHPGPKIGGLTQAIATPVAGLQISDFYPRVAEQMDSLCVIRSLVSKEGDHERASYLLKTGYRPDPTLIHPALGAILAHELPEEGVEVPRNISILDAQYPSRGGYLGDAYDAFKIHNPEESLQNMVARAEGKRQERRLKNLDVIENSFSRTRQRQTEATLHRDTVKRALTMMNSEQLKAFKIADEPAALRQAYGENSFGRACLVARRLVATGVRAVEVNLGGFDSHVNNHELQKKGAELLDPAFATLISDLKQQDLLDSTVVLCMGEFGRTPNINPLEGRDHWPTGFSAVVGGGGFRSGLVIGATDPEGKKTAPEDPIEIADLFATILKTVGVTWNKEVNTPIGRPMRLNSGKPLDRLLM